MWSPSSGKRSPSTSSSPAPRRATKTSSRPSALGSGGCFWSAAAIEYDDRPGPVRDAIAAALDGWVAELTRQAGLAGAADPDRHAFELYSLGMGANSRLRLSGDERVLDHARAALARLEAELHSG